MSSDNQPASEFEIAHVLCTDIVGYSKLMIDQQSDYLRKLNEVVRGTDQFQRLEGSGKLLRIPTGDGMVLVFFTHPQDPTECAVQIAQALKSHPEIQLRMGVHSGPVSRVRDVDGRSNVAGAGINVGQRVMDCGDGGHILLSKRVAEDLAHYSRWRPHLHDLGECEVKHGLKIEIINLHTDAVGNPAVPAKLQEGKAPKVEPRPAARGKLIAAVYLALLALAAVWFYSQRARNPPPAAESPGKSIAILPFKPLVAADRDEALEAGMADTLITKLSSSREIIVPSLASVAKYTAEDAVGAGRALRVNSVLEGNVHKSGDRIRITARLIKVADGSSLWAGTFDEKFTDIFSAQDAISRRVADALAVRLSEEEQKRLTKHYTENTEAYQLYLKGRFYWNKYTDEGFRKSIGYFKQAVEMDPSYALAYSGLADSYSLLGEMGLAPPKEVFPQGRGYAEKALALDESLAPAHVSLAIVKLFYEWDFAGAGKDLLRAKEINPNYPDAYHFYGHYLELVRRFDEAIVETRRGVELDPTSLIINSELGMAYYMARQHDQAIGQLRKTLELDPAFSYASYEIAQAYAQKGMYQEELAELNRALPMSAGWSFIVAEQGYVAAALGDRSQALKIIQELDERAAREYIDPVLIAYIYWALADKEQAFACLEKGFEQRSGIMCWIDIEPKFDSLRSDPRFTDLLHRMGLP